MSGGAKSQGQNVQPLKQGINSTNKSSVPGWKNFENNIMINLSGQSGEKMDLIPQDNQQVDSNSGRFYGNRQGLMTSSSNTRPTAMGKNLNQLCNQKESLQSLRRTFYNNSNANTKPMTGVLNQQPNTTSSGVRGLAHPTGGPLIGGLVGPPPNYQGDQNRGMVRGLGGLVIERRKSLVGCGGQQRMPIEIKKPNISDIKKKE